MVTARQGARIPRRDEPDVAAESTSACHASIVCLYLILAESLAYGRFATVIGRTRDSRDQDGQDAGQKYPVECPRAADRGDRRAQALQLVEI